MHDLSREQKLYRVGRAGIFDQEFFNEFKDLSELVELGVFLGVRRLITLVVEADTEPQHVIAATRLLALFSGKERVDDAPVESVSERIGTELRDAIERTKKAL